MKIRNFLKDADITATEQNIILSAAEKLAREPRLISTALTGQAIGLFFEKPSLRTRVSSETACLNLGASPIQLRADELHFHRGETPQDSIKVLAGYISLLMARVYKQTLLEQLAEPNSIPIVNGLSNQWHPLQALADILTLRQLFHGEIKGRTLTYVGDGNNVCNSLLIAGALSGLTVIASSPASYQVSDDIIFEANRLGKETGGCAKIITDPHQAVRDSDAIYTDVWASMGDEAEKEERHLALSPYQVNKTLVSHATKRPYLMHCLPAHRNDEITSEMLDSDKSVVVQEAHNRLPSTAALFLFMLKPELCIEFAKKK